MADKYAPQKNICSLEKDYRYGSMPIDMNLLKRQFSRMVIQYDENIALQEF